MTVDTAHLERVRREYEATKADHAAPVGCDDCGRGLVPTNGSDGWEYDDIADILLCRACVVELVRYEAQMAGVEARRFCRKSLHDLTDPANQYKAKNGAGKVIIRCRPCYKTTNIAAKKRWRQRKLAAEKGAS